MCNNGRFPDAERSGHWAVRVAVEPSSTCRPRGPSHGFCRGAVQDGRDPIAEKAREVEPTFGECAHHIESIKSEWRNAKHEYQWNQTLTGLIRDKRVSEVGTEEVLKVLNPGIALANKQPEFKRKPSGRRKPTEQSEAVLLSQFVDDLKTNIAEWRSATDERFLLDLEKDLRSGWTAEALAKESSGHTRFSPRDTKSVIRRLPGKKRGGRMSFSWTGDRVGRHSTLDGPWPSSPQSQL